MSFVWNRNSRRIWIGIILIAMGLSLALTSYPSIQSEEIQKIAQRVLLMEGNSSSYLNISLPVHASRAFVWIVGSPELQGVLNSTYDYSSSVGLKTITITLTDGVRNMSVSVYAVAILGDYWLPQPVYGSWFSIPSGWGAVSRVFVSNSESHPVCWIASCIFYEQFIHFEWLAAMVLGVISLLIGLVISVTALRRKVV